jgi:hypothetical protein
VDVGSSAQRAPHGFAPVLPYQAFFPDLQIASQTQMNNEVSMPYQVPQLPIAYCLLPIAI